MIVGAEMCRVSIKARSGQADVALPADVPIAELIPWVYDILGETPAPCDVCCLCRPGQPPLDSSKSLLENGIDDGALLMLVAVTAATPAVTVLHAADAAEVAGSNLRPWTAPQSRLTAVVFAIVLAGTAGLVVVPGELGAPNLLLAAASVTAAATIGVRATRYGRTALLAVVTTGTLVATAALGATVLDARVASMGAALATMAVGVLSIPARLALRMSGLTSYIGGDLDPDSDGVDDDVWNRSARAQQGLTALVVGASTAATAATTAVVLAGDRTLPQYLVAGAVTALLIVRSRVHQHAIRRTALLMNGLASAATVLVSLRLTDPQLTAGVCGAATLLAAAAVWRGFAASPALDAPPVRRGLDLLDCLVLTAVIPLACWSCGVYETARGMSL